MSIALLNAPDDFALTQGGRMTAEFALSGRTVSAGTRAINRVALGGPLAEGRVIRIQWGSQAVEFTARALPAEPTDMPTGDGNDAHYTAIIAIWQDYFAMREDFTNFRIEPGGLGTFRGIAFEARKPGLAYSITPSLDGTVAYLNDLTGADPVYRARYSAYVELWVQPTTGPHAGTLERDHFERVASQSLEAGEDGVAALDVGAILHPLLTPDLPDVLNPFPYLSRSSHRAYYLAYAEAWGSPLRPASIRRDSIRYAYLGGASYLRRGLSGYPFLSGRVGNNPAADAALRTGPPDAVRYVPIDGLQYLTYLNTRMDLTDIRLACDVTFNNLITVGTTDLFGPVAVWKKGEKLTVPVGVQQLGLPDRYPTNTITEYSLYLIRNGLPVSRPYRFVVDYAYRPHARQFLFVNSLGCPETVTTYGKGSVEWSRFGEVADQALPIGYDPDAGAMADYGVSLQAQVEVVTGFRTQRDLATFLDFYRSPERHQLRADGTGVWQLLPITVNVKSVKEAKDGEVLFAHSFSYAYRWRDHWYTDDSGVGDDLPPPDFRPAGTVEVQVSQVVRSRDDTVPQAARDLTPTDLTQLRQVGTWGNHAEMLATPRK
jgi:hypothetical protein